MTKKEEEWLKQMELPENKQNAMQASKQQKLSANNVAPNQVASQEQAMKQAEQTASSVPQSVITQQSAQVQASPTPVPTQATGQSQAPSQTRPQNDEFLQWWVDNAGVGEFDSEKGFYRTDSMNDYDYRIGKNLYTGYQNKQNLEREYLTAQENLKNQTAQSQAQAYAEKMLMQKYLPSLMNKYGYAGNVGLSDDAVLGLNRNYNNSLNTINSNYNQNMQELTNDYNSNRLSIDSSVSDRNDALYEYQREKEEQSQAEWYNSLNYTLSDMISEDADFDDINDYLEKYKNKISQDQYEMLKEQIDLQKDKLTNPYSNANLEKVLSGETAVQGQDNKNYFVVDSTGVTSQGSKNASVFVTSFLTNTQQKRIILGKSGYLSLPEIYNQLNNEIKMQGYDSLYDKNIKNGTTLLLKVSEDAKVAKYITYINGKWYHTERA